MLQSFIGTVAQPGLIAIRRDGDSRPSPGVWPPANMWAILDSIYLPEISSALRQNRPKEALLLLTQYAQSFGKLS